MKKKLLTTVLVGTLLLSPTNAFALTKNETVYVNLNGDGSINKSTVTNHLFNKETSSLEDETELKELLNINGKETYTLNGNKLTWDTNGKDIFYSGISEKELPIKVTTTYYLNGEETELKNILKKEGTVKIVFHFQNDLKQTVKVNGIYQTVYTPFFVTMGTMFDSNVSNVTITNGKVVDTGSRNMVIGIASPGLYESLGMSEFSSMDTITLEFDTESFTLPNIYMVATPKLLSDTDFNIFSKLNSLTSDINLLQENMDALESGAKQLEEGSDSLVSGASSIASNLKTVSTSLTQLESGSISLKEGLTTLKSSLENASSSMTMDSTSIQNLMTLKETNTKTISTILSKTGMTYEELQTVYVSNNLSTYEGDNETYLALKEAYELSTLLSKNNEAITSMLTNLNTISTTLNSMMSSLNDALTQLETGATTLSNGLTQVKTGVSKLSSGADALYNGAQELSTGASTLASGASTFNTEGIQKLSAYASKIQNYSNKIEAMTRLSENYSGYASDNASETIFVYKISSQK